MSAGILVFIEQRKGQVKKASFEALYQAKLQAQRIGGEVVALLIAEKSDLVAEITKHQPAKILLAISQDFTEYATETYTNALVEAVKMVSPKYVFAANTAMVRDLFPRAAARLNAPCVSDVIELNVEGTNLLAVKPIYSGKVYGKFEFENDLSFLTLRPNVFPCLPPQGSVDVPTEELKLSPINVRAKVVETHAAAGAKVELSEASIIVSGGRGIQGPENWGLLQSLCDVLGAALGASRAVVDAGWIDHQHQVGQTGKTVSPQLYIACGISGAIQHLAGMSTSKIIVAINKNADAPIFKLATYGLVGDCLEIVPKITEEIKQLQ